MEQIEKLLDAREPQQALEAISALPVTAQSLTYKARALAQMERLTEAKQAGQKALELEPNYAAAHGIVGGIHARQGDFPEALKHLDLAVSGEPEVTRHLVMRVQVSINSRQPERAYQDIQTLVGKGQQAEIFSEHLTVLCQTGRSQEAQDLMNRKGEFNLDVATLAKAQMQWHLAQREYQEALETVIRWAEQCPDDYSAWDASFQLLKALGQTDKLAVVAKEAYPHHSSKAELLENLCLSLIATGQVAEAYTYVEKTLRQNPGKLYDYQTPIDYMEQSGMAQQVLALMDECLQQVPDQGMAWMLRGALTQDDQEALKYLVRAASSEDAVIVFEAATVCASRGMYKEAHTIVDRALTLDPNHYESHHTKALIFQETNQLEAAVESYNRALALNPEAAMTLNNRGNCYSSLTQFEKAFADYDRAIALDSDYFQPHFNKGNELTKMGRFSEALPYLERAAKLDAEHAEAHYFLGLCLQRMGQESPSKEAYQRACQLNASYYDRPYELLRTQVESPKLGELPKSAPTTRTLDQDFLGEIGRLVASGLQDKEFVARLDEQTYAGTVLIISVAALRLSQSLGEWDMEPLYSQLGDLTQNLESHMQGCDSAKDDFFGVQSTILSWVVSNLCDPMDIMGQLEMAKELVGTLGGAARRISKLVTGQAAARDWKQQDSVLKQKLQALGAEGKEYRVDFRKGLYYWIDGETTLAVADCRVLGTYQSQNMSFLAGWANPSEAIDESSIDRVLGVLDCQEGVARDECWQIVSGIADETPDLEYLLSVGSGDLVYYLGVFNLRKPSAGEGFSSGDGAVVVQDMLGKMEHLIRVLKEYQLNDEDTRSVFYDYAKRCEQQAQLFKNQEMGQSLALLSKEFTRLGKSLGKKTFGFVGGGKITDQQRYDCVAQLEELRTTSF